MNKGQDMQHQAAVGHTGQAYACCVQITKAEESKAETNALDLFPLLITSGKKIVPVLLFSKVYFSTALGQH